MKNKPVDLQNHLFAQMERLGDEDLDPDQLQAELKRSKAMSDLAEQAISNARLVLDVEEFRADHCNKASVPMLGLDTTS